MNVVLNFHFDKREINKFDARCEIAIKKVLTGTKKATIEACEEILRMSLLEVPEATGTLAASAFYEVRKRPEIKSYKYEGRVGYGGNGDPINPRTGKPASYYMVAVHERLDQRHVKGKAKFLEDPVRRYAATNFTRTVFKHAKNSLADMSTR